MYCTPVGPAAPGRPAGSSRLTGCLATSLVRLELLALDVGGEPLRRGQKKQRGSAGAHCPEPRRQAASPGSAQPLASATGPGSSARTTPVPGAVHAPSKHNAPFLLLPRGSRAQRKGHAGEGGGRSSLLPGTQRTASRSLCWPRRGEGRPLRAPRGQGRVAKGDKDAGRAHSRDGGVFRRGAEGNEVRSGGQSEQSLAVIGARSRNPHRSPGDRLPAGLQALTPPGECGRPCWWGWRAPTA